PEHAQVGPGLTEHARQGLRVGAGRDDVVVARPQGHGQSVDEHAVAVAEHQAHDAAPSGRRRTGGRFRSCPPLGISIRTVVPGPGPLVISSRPWHSCSTRPTTDIPWPLPDAVVHKPVPSSLTSTEALCSSELTSTCTVPRSPAARSALSSTLPI